MQTYFISSHNYIKIGKSLNPVERLAQLQAFHPATLKLILVIEGDHEKVLHRQFAKYRKQGEWFRFSSEIRTFILEHPAFNPDLLRKENQKTGRRSRPKSSKHNVTRLRHERLKRDINQTGLAAATGLFQSDISKIERGLLIPTPDQLQRIADVFGVTPDELISYSRTASTAQILEHLRCECQRCGYEWIRKPQGTPRVCLRCKSALWQVPKGEQPTPATSTEKTA